MSSLSSVPVSAATPSSAPATAHLQLHPPTSTTQHHSIHPLHIYRDHRDSRDLRDPRDLRDTRDYDHPDSSRAAASSASTSTASAAAAAAAAATAAAASALAPLNPNTVHRPPSPIRKRKRDGEDPDSNDKSELDSVHISNSALRRRLSSPNGAHRRRVPFSSGSHDEDSDDDESVGSQSNSMNSRTGSPSLPGNASGRVPGPTATTTLPLGTTPSRGHSSMPFSPGTPVTPATPDTPGGDQVVTTAAGVRVRADRERKRKFARRTKTGCLTCRKRKKKCDELKPHCNNCSKGGFECEGYVGKVVWGGHRPGDGGPESARSVTTTPVTTPIGQSAIPTEISDPLGLSMSRSARRGPPRPMMLPDETNGLIAVGPPPPSVTPLNITHVLNETTSSSSSVPPSTAPKQHRSSAGSTNGHIPGRETDLRLRQPNAGSPVPHFAHHMHPAMAPMAMIQSGSYTAPPAALTFASASSRASGVHPPSTAATSSFSRGPFFSPHPATTPNAHPFAPPPPPSSVSSSAVPAYSHMPPPPPQPSALLQPLPSPARHHYSELPSAQPYTMSTNDADMADRLRMMAGEVFVPSATRLAVDRSSARVAVAQYNAACDPRSGISLSERRKLLVRVLCTPEARERSHTASMTGGEDVSGSIVTSSPRSTNAPDIPAALMRLGPNVEVGLGFRCLYGYNITIGSGSTLGDQVSLLDPCRIRIGSRVVLGDRVMIAGEVGAPGSGPGSADDSGPDDGNGPNKAGTDSPSGSNSRSQSKQQTPLQSAQSYSPPVRSQGKPVVIDDDVWIGPGAIICGGVHIGSSAWIGPGSVVSEDVPPGTVGMGNPFVPRR